MTTSTTEVSARSPQGESPLNARRIHAAVVVATGLAMVALASRLDVGTLQTPGPGLWPLIASTALIVLGAALLARPTQRPDAPAVSENIEADAVGVEDGDRATGKVVGAIASIVAYVLIFPIAGFMISTAAMLFFWLKVIAGERWTIAFGVSAIAVAALHLGFVEFLNAPLPTIALAER